MSFDMETLTPIELYGVVMTAIVMAGLGLLAIREFPKLETIRQKAVMALGLFFMYGAPVILGLNALGR